MRINKTDFNARQSKSVKPNARSSEFSSMLEAPQPSRIPSGSPIAPLTNIIALTNADPDNSNQRNAYRFASNLLDDLKKLHLEISLGNVSQERLQTLSSQLDKAPPPSDATMADLIDEIKTRVAVELARLSPP